MLDTCSTPYSGVFCSSAQRVRTSISAPAEGSLHRLPYPVIYTDQRKLTCQSCGSTAMTPYIHGLVLPCLSVYLSVLSDQAYIAQHILLAMPLPHTPTQNIRSTECVPRLHRPSSRMASALLRTYPGHAILLASAEFPLVCRCWSMGLLYMAGCSGFSILHKVC